MSHLTSHKPQLLARIRRIAGQIAAIEKAVESDAVCSTVLHQVAGARGAINGLLDELIEDHVREHVAHPDLTPVERAAGAEELIVAIRRYGK
ncbi:MAG: metal/formaldehyde-sensitive transcriptional repressor [Rubritepida sp.]|nr:metal/formaldehyde-sensitive transcriptional repressor [Rubritepida sp.]